MAPMAVPAESRSRKGTAGAPVADARLAAQDW